MPQTNYRQLSEPERHAISLGLQQGMTQRAIARALGRSPSTISRECRRNVGGVGYASTYAQQRCERRRRFCRPPPKLHRNSSLFACVRGYLLKEKYLLVVYSERKVSFYWLRKFVACEFKNPSVNRVQFLFEYLSKQPLF